MKSNNRAILSVENLKTYFYYDEGTVKAVNGVSFDVFSGKTLGIIGESGCGKSVTARSILRILNKPGKIVDGKIILRRNNESEYQEIDLVEMNPRGKEIRSIRGGEIGLIFQEPMTAFSFHYTIGNQIMESIQIHQGGSDKEVRNNAIELLDSVGIPKPERRIDEYAFQLSGGLRQRALIAKALGGNPGILIADEPTTALDVTTQAQILKLLKNLQKNREMALILITHDMGVIAEMADSVTVMYLGEVVEQGTVQDIFYEPGHPYTKSLLKSIPSIFARPRTKLPTIEGTVPHPYNRPAGCPFHPRCTEVNTDMCKEGKAQLTTVNDKQEHKVRCFLYQDKGCGKNE